MEERRPILIKEFVLGVGITALFFILLALSPALGLATGFVTPLPIAYFYIRLGRPQGLLYFASSVFIAWFSVQYAGVEGDVSFFVVIGALGILLPEFMRRNWGIEKTVMASVASVLTLALALLLYYSWRLATPAMQLIETHIHESLQYSIKFYAEFGMSSEQIESIKENVPEITKTILGLLPSIVVVSASFFAWINVLMMRFLFQKTQIPCPDYGDLAYWKIPDWLVWFVIASGGMMLLPLPEIKLVGFNGLIIFLFVYLLQGFSIVHFFFKKKSVPRFLRTIFYLFLFVYQTLLLVVAAVGLFDIWIDFRKMNRPLKDSTV
ncbi:MAG: YybS family protein [Deltaproteobacteria bacterium]|nr:YybS family protein [Deltaproteobacteria bacterium]